MLRRPATTITISPADVEAYEANRQRKLWEKQQQQQHQRQQQQQQQQQQQLAQSSGGNGAGRDQQAATRPPQRNQRDRIMGGQAHQDSQQPRYNEDVVMQE